MTIPSIVLLVVDLLVSGVIVACARGRIRVNSLAGIRLPRVMASESAWRAGHAAALPATLIIPVLRRGQPWGDARVAASRDVRLPARDQPTDAKSPPMTVITAIPARIATTRIPARMIRRRLTDPRWKELREIPSRFGATMVKKGSWFDAVGSYVTSACFSSSIG